ncbi:MULTISPECIES: hypothetical protein [unclassified Bradyrhizobium]|nr:MULTISPECIES: hypothetical protein [unclassified Bradyrhizobium]
MQRDEAILPPAFAPPTSTDVQIRTILSGFYGIGRKGLFSKALPAT